MKVKKWLVIKENGQPAFYIFKNKRNAKYHTGSHINSRVVYATITFKKS